MNGIDRCIDMRIKLFGLYGRSRNVREVNETITFPEGDIEKQAEMLMSMFDKTGDDDS